MTSLLDPLLRVFEMLLRPVVFGQLLGIAIAMGLVLLLLSFSRRSFQEIVVPAGTLALGLVLILLGMIGLPNRIVLVIAAVFGSLALLQGIHSLLERIHMEKTFKGFFSLVARPAVIVIAIILLIHAAGFDDLWSSPLLPVDEKAENSLQITIGELFRSVLAFYLLIITSGLFGRIGGLISRTFLGISRASSAIIAELSRYIYIFFGLIFILLFIGFTGNILLAVAASLSVGIGFGLRDLVANFVSGIWLLLEGLIRPGDVVYIGQDPCQVHQLGPRAARLWRERDNADLVVPNYMFFSETTTTYTGVDRLRRSEVQVRAALHHQPAQVIALLKLIPPTVDGILSNPPPSVFLLDYEPAAVLYSLRFMINDPMCNVSITSAVRRAIWDCFQSHGIEIPFPKQVFISDARHRAQLAEKKFGETNT
ncbi:MAG: mechanosensitive ion channel family protein [Prochlorococcus sp.]|nr:mechanosensitive ion channel [Prochlorococcaceae cyanobacterium Fu_MAG_50]